MEAVKEQIRRDLDSVATFMTETGYKPSTDKRTLLKTLREEYNEFCKLNNCRQVGYKMFSQRLRSAGLGGVREIHDAAHGPGPNRSGICCAGAGEMVGRYDGTSLPVEGEGIGYDLPGELGRSPRTTSCPNSKAAGPAAPPYHSEEEVAWPEPVTKFCRMTVCANWN